jgi:hypothetical protein
MEKYETRSVELEEARQEPDVNGEAATRKIARPDEQAL